jgi:hypothetical protein
MANAQEGIMFEIIGMVIVALLLLLVLIGAIIETRGRILLAIPVGVLMVFVVWAGAQLSELWYSPDFGRAIHSSARVAIFLLEAIAVIGILGWIGSKRPALAISLGVAIVVVVLLAVGFVANTPTVVKVLR